MPGHTFDVYSFLVLTGIIQGIFLSIIFLLKPNDVNPSNRIMGLFMLSISFMMIEGWLNYTRLIFDVIHLANFSEPLNFILAPTLFLFFSRQLGYEANKNDKYHYIMFVIWIGYCMFHYTQSADFKYNAIVSSMRFDLPLKDVTYTYTDNPLGIRSWVNEMTIIHLIIYAVWSTVRIRKKFKSTGDTFFGSKNAGIRSVRSSFIHMSIIIGIIVFVKAWFQDDVGDIYIHLYLTFMYFSTSFQVMLRSDYFDHPATFLELPISKYQKSAMTDEQKEEITEGIKREMETNHYYRNNLASLAELSDRLHERTHNVSQVINESMDKNFYELLSWYRVEEAKQILKSEDENGITIEELAENVGYNSKSAFNNAFKKWTGKTPSEYRKS